MADTTPTRACSITVIRDPMQHERTRETVRCQAGQWLSEAAPADLVGDWVAVDSGKVLERDEWATHLLVPGAEILLYPRVTGGSMGQIAMGIIFPPLGIYYGMRALGAPSWVGLVTMGAFGGGAGVALAGKMASESILTPAVRPPSFPSNGLSSGGDRQGSPTYGFNGISTSTRIGAVIPVVYGAHRAHARAEATT
jgi:hypothetical protein